MRKRLIAAAFAVLAFAAPASSRGFKSSRIDPAIFDVKNYSSASIASKVMACARLVLREDHSCAYVDYGDDSANDGRVYVMCRKAEGGYLKRYCRNGLLLPE